MIHLPESIRDRLKSNWGDRMHSMACYAEVKISMHNGKFAWYLLAMNPEDEDEIAFLPSVDPYEVQITSLRIVGESFDDEGEYPVIDGEYRRMWAAELFKRIGGQNGR